MTIRSPFSDKWAFLKKKIKFRGVTSFWKRKKKLFYEWLVAHPSRGWKSSSSLFPKVDWGRKRLSHRKLFFLTGGTAEKKFYGRSLPPRDRKKETRCSWYHFLAEEISKVSNLVREVAREIRAGRFVCVHLFWFTFLVPSGLLWERRKRYTFFSVT